MDWEAFYGQFREPDFIAGYEIQNRLGGGAFGDVYKARKQSIGKAYAIKFLKLEDDAQRAVVERELSTVRHFAAIDHPNLVTIEDMGVVLGVPFLIMGYAGEDTLARRLSKGPLDPATAMPVFVQACRGVLALHDRRLVHFDLKPSNVFLKGDVARVGDYGLSKLLTDGRMTLSFGRGTPQYMAPEILRSRADHRADIYSLGVMLYEALVGDLPFKPEGDGALILREVDEPPPFPEGFPERVRSVIEGCLRLSPDDRYDDVGALLADLDQTARQGDSVTVNWADPPAAESSLAQRVKEEGAERARADTNAGPGTAKPDSKVGSLPTGQSEAPAKPVAGGGSSVAVEAASAHGGMATQVEPSQRSGGPADSPIKVSRTAIELAKGAAAVANGVWQGLRGTAEPSTEEVDRDADPLARGQQFGSQLRRDFGSAGKDLRDAGQELGRAAKDAKLGLGRLRRQPKDAEPASSGGPDQEPAQPQEESDGGLPRAEAAGAQVGGPQSPKAKAQALLRGMSMGDVPEAAPGRPAAALPVPVPPKVEGGLVGTITSTLVVGFEVLFALLSSLGRGLYLGFKRVADRLLRRSGSVAARVLRFGLFLSLMGALGFALTLLGMVFLDALQLRP